MPGAPSPRYPDALRIAGVEGSVVAQFVVNADGRPDMSTFKVVKSSNAGLPTPSGYRSRQ